VELWDIKPELCADASISGLPARIAAAASSESVLIARGESDIVDALEERVAALTGFRHDPTRVDNGTRMHYTQVAL